MKKLIAALLFLIPNTIYAQIPGNSFESVTIHFNQNKCDGSKINKLINLHTEKIAPILNQSIKDGKLINWGILTHSFGDEWNFNTFLVTENNITFLEFWGHFWNQLEKNWPTYKEDVSKICTEHKDNIYRQVAGYVPLGGNE